MILDPVAFFFQSQILTVIQRRTRIVTVMCFSRYVSCVVGCPYSGKIEPKSAADMAVTLSKLGCYEVSMGDTTGIGTPAEVTRMFEVNISHVNLMGFRSCIWNKSEKAELFPETDLIFCE